MKRIISLVKDPHLTFVNNDVPRCLLICEYRMLVEKDDGLYQLLSVCNDDFAGRGTTKEELESNTNLVECSVCTPEIVVEQVDYWVKTDHEDPYKTLIETIEYIGKAGVVLSDAEMKRVYLLMKKYDKI
ncbi:MAG: hypothetical protein Q4D33_12865 [Prevotellaceae bacterium]|nr:hypothetical protein [Prevotellaceae bacterium]